jgi:hypothetical protein
MQIIIMSRPDKDNRISIKKKSITQNILSIFKIFIKEARKAQ